MRTPDANGILARLNLADRDLLEPRLKPVRLRLRQPLERPQRQIRAAYFVERGLVSIVAGGKTRLRQAEVGVIGREGMTGLAVVLGLDRSPHDTFVQREGSALCITASDLREALEASQSLFAMLLRYVHVTSVSMAHTALANARGTIEQRLARWLLMAHDRSEDDEIHLTHEFLSLMLGNRRAGVTTALSALDARGLISHSRARITVLDREGLKQLAGDLFGEPEVEYARVLGKERLQNAGARESIGSHRRS